MLTIVDNRKLAAFFSVKAWCLVDPVHPSLVSLDLVALLQCQTFCFLCCRWSRVIILLTTRGLCHFNISMPFLTLAKTVGQMIGVSSFARKLLCFSEVWEINCLCVQIICREYTFSTQNSIKSGSDCLISLWYKLAIWWSCEEPLAKGWFAYNLDPFWFSKLTLW